MTEIDVRTARDEDLAACFDIRRDVFIVGQNVPEALEIDGLDAECTHFIALIGGRPVGTARLRITADGIAKAERVAVRADVRGLGLGHRVMQALEDEAKRRGFLEVVLAAQIQVIPFYEQRGYRAEGPVFVDAGIDHRFMRRTLGDP